MMKLAFLLLLAVGYSLQTPVEEPKENVPSSTTTDTPVDEPDEPEMYPDGECPEYDLEFPVYLSDLKNCSVFYQCSNGIPYRMTCSYPLEFNARLQVCDFPGMSGCINDKISPYRIIGRCPPNSSIKKLLRDSEDNTIYYECVNGEAVRRQCPPDTVFTFKRICEPVAEEP